MNASLVLATGPGPARARGWLTYDAQGGVVD